MWNAAIITYYQTEDPSGTPGPPRRSSRNRPFSHKSSRWGAKNPRNPSANLQREHTRVAAGNSWNVNLSTVSQVQPGHTDQTEIKDGTAVIKRATHVIKPAAPRNNRRPARNNVRFSELVSESMAEITSFQLSSETGGEFFSRQGGNDSIKNMKSSLKRGCEQECVSESEEPLDDLESKLSNHMQRLSSWDRATANTVDQDRSDERSNDEETISSSKESEPNGLHN